MMQDIDLDFHGIDRTELDISLKSLYYFVVVAETGSITKAARQLYLTQSMLSKNIILLEEHLQVPLLERSGRKIALTEEGQYIYKKWKTLIKNYCRENAVMRNLRHSAPEKFRVGFFPALDVLCYFEPYLERIQRKWPEMFVDVVRMNNTRLFEHMNGEMIDLLFTLEEDIPEKKELYEWKRIGTTPLVALIGRHHRLAGREQICAQDLHGEQLFFNNPGGTLSREVWLERFFEQNGLEREHLLLVNNDLTAAANAAGERGIALGPKCSFGNLTHRVSMLPVGDITFHVVALWRKDISTAIREMICAILE